MSAPIRRNCLAALDRLVETHARASVGASHDQDVGARVARVHGGLDPRERLVAPHHRLPLRVAAPLRRHLVFEHDAGEPGARVALHRPLDVLRAAEAGVAVADERRVGRSPADVLALLHQLAVGDETRIGHGQPIGRHGEAAHESQVEAGFLDEPRRHRVVAARHDEESGPNKKRSQPISWRHERIIVGSWLPGAASGSAGANHELRTTNHEPAR